MEAAAREAGMAPSPVLALEAAFPYTSRQTSPSSGSDAGEEERPAEVRGSGRGPRRVLLPRLLPLHCFQHAVVGWRVGAAFCLLCWGFLGTGASLPL